MKLSFSHDGYEYEIQFRREYKDRQIKLKVGGTAARKSTYPYTVVEIYEHNKDGRKKLFRAEKVGCHPSDFKPQTYRAGDGLHERGRKAALRAICKPRGLSYSFKEKMWEAYFGRFAEAAYAQKQARAELSATLIKD